MPILSPTCKIQIDQASRRALTNEFSGLTSNWANSKWFANDTKNAQYLAASSIAHLQDAWSYFGKAIYSTLNNDTYTARHMAYYAELRAAMGLLASEGIGIFNNKHYFLDSTGIFQRFNDIYIDSRGNTKNELGTHQMVWLVIEHWSTQNKARKLLEKITTIEGISLQTWVNKYKTQQWGSLTHQLFKEIGLDLQHMAQDRDIRNGVSYRPSEVSFPNPINTNENYKYVSEIWNLLEPSAGGSFHNLDKFVLKHVLSLLKNNDPMMDDKKYLKKIYLMLESNLSNKASIKSYLAFLSSIQSSSIIAHAMTTHPNINAALSDPKNHLQVLSRTVLLLRIATGAIQLLMKDASVNLTHIQFWTTKIIQQNGLSPISSLPLSGFEDLWSDIADIALSDVESWIKSGNNDFNEMKRELSYSTLLLSEGERAMLWGLST
ncbi:MAG: hypothetical protein PHI02_02455 [Sulfurovaceae bacterium]|nr:hypothetical protein [Sulfurovaceae bacterium]